MITLRDVHDDPTLADAYASQPGVPADLALWALAEAADDRPAVIRDAGPTLAGRRPMVGPVAAVVCLLICLVAGAMAENDAIQEQMTYCDNVDAGVYPDYRNAYAALCR